MGFLCLTRDDIFNRTFARSSLNSYSSQVCHRICLSKDANLVLHASRKMLYYFTIIFCSQYLHQLHKSWDDSRTFFKIIF